MGHREPKKEAKQKSNQTQRPLVIHNEDINKAAPKKISKGIE